MSKLAFLSLIAFSLISMAFSAPDNEKVDLTQISQIPAGTYNFLVYSGYLFIDNSTTQNRSFHYVFVTSQNNPTTDPVLLWLNGGPGCSSLDGLVYEHGPWLFEPNSTQMKWNPHAWNGNASVLYLESPVGVGFSNGTALAYNDTFTAQDNLRALLEFFGKFPEYQQNEFYISGESYGGIYIPSLAQAIHWYNQGSLAQIINFKGLAVGNGVVQNSPQEKTVALFNFLARHNLVSFEVALKFNDLCHLNYDPQLCPMIVNDAYSYLGDISLNPYDVLNTCWNDTSQILPPGFQKDYARFFELISVDTSDLQGINPFAALPPCIDVYGATLFFNNKTVKQALHVPADIVWSICSQTLVYKGGDFANMTDTYGFLLSKGYRIVYYSGDSDWVCSTDNAEIFFRNLAKKFGIPLTNPKTPWHIPGLYPDEPQTTGFYSEFENLRFVSFMGVGHMVPQWNKPGGQKMINAFLFNLNLD